ncbi:MAG: helix-turn-helix transcriptional regulator [Sulfuritalea sp.]|nr:helix-turn-helix transcriptional regulator [Sulfuritalea sp.]
MVGATTPKRKPPVSKRAPAKPAAKPQVAEPTESGLVDQMRSMAGKVLDMGAATVGAASTLHTAANIAKALLPGLSEPGVWGKTGATLRRLRKATGLTITEVGAAINLKDPSLIEAWENGRIAVPFALLHPRLQSGPVAQPGSTRRRQTADPVRARTRVRQYLPRRRRGAQPERQGVRRSPRIHSRGFRNGHGVSRQKHQARHLKGCAS